VGPRASLDTEAGLCLYTLEFKDGAEECFDKQTENEEFHSWLEVDPTRKLMASSPQHNVRLDMQCYISLVRLAPGQVPTRRWRFMDGS
jgi:hypothetical protein